MITARLFKSKLVAIVHTATAKPAPYDNLFESHSRRVSRDLLNVRSLKIAKKIVVICKSYVWCDVTSHDGVAERLSGLFKKILSFEWALE